MEKANDIIKTIGGILILILIALLISLIWFYSVLIFQLIATNCALILLIAILDSATTDDEHKPM